MSLFQPVRAAALAFAFLGLSFLGGCAGGVTAAGPGAYEAGEAYQVNLGRRWSDISGVTPGRPSNVRLLTIDGPLLNRLYLAHDIKPEAGLIRPSTRDETAPVYRADMTGRELVEFVAQSVEAWGYLNVETEALLPALFAGRPGVAFAFAAQTEEGLDIRGRAAAAAQDERLQAIIYLAPREHYYALHQAEVDAIFASVLGAPNAAPAAAASAAAKQTALARQSEAAPVS
jgi:hypothetical protein